LVEFPSNRVRLYEAPTGIVTCERFFRAWRFRPARSTGIDVLLGMLKPVPAHS
jgi:hypothetical protein